MMKLFRTKKWQKIITKSNLFDVKFYLFAYSDVRFAGIDPIEHFVKYGASEGRNPSSEFNTSFYLEHYNDVRESGTNPLVHYILYGKEEGRLKNNDELNIQIIERSQLFDQAYYLSAYPDVRLGDVDPTKHYIEFGAGEGRNPSEAFDTNFYLEQYEDVRNSDINPLVHYIVHGREEKRLTKREPSVQKFQGTDVSMNLVSKKVKGYFAQKKDTKKIVVYTAIIGDYDTLKLPEVFDEDVSYVCFSDNYHVGYNIWDIRFASYWHDDPTMRARFYKLHPHLFFSDYEYAIWIDANILIRKSMKVQELIDKHLSNKTIISMCTHPRRSCVYEELDACVRYNKDDFKVMKQQLDSYREDGLSRNIGLQETGVIVCQPKLPETEVFFNSWWSELYKHSKRDQLALPYVLYKNNIACGSLFEKGYDFRTDKIYFKYYFHNENKSFEEYIYPKMNLEVNKTILINPARYVPSKKYEYKNNSTEIEVIVIGDRLTSEQIIEIEKNVESSSDLHIINTAGRKTGSKFRKNVEIYSIENKVEIAKQINSIIKNSKSKFCAIINENVILPDLWMQKLKESSFDETILLGSSFDIRKETVLKHKEERSLSNYKHKLNLISHEVEKFKFLSQPIYDDVNGSVLLLNNKNVNKVGGLIEGDPLEQSVKILMSKAHKFGLFNTKILDLVVISEKTNLIADEFHIAIKDKIENVYKAYNKKIINIAVVVDMLKGDCDYTGTTYIRTLLPLVGVMDGYHGINYTIINNDLIDQYNDDLFISLDLVITLRNALDCKGTDKIIDISNRYDIPIIYDIDDNLFVDAPNFKLPENKKNELEKLISKSTLVSTSTIPLKKLMETKTKNKVDLRKNSLLGNIWLDKAPIKKIKNNDSIKILYMGTRSHDADLKIVEDAAKYIKTKFKHVEFYIIGGIQKQLDWMIDIKFSAKNYIEFVKKFRTEAQKYDFAICPLEENEFNTYKSSIKYLDYSLAGLACIYSEHPIYEEIIRNNNNGLLAKNNTASWIKALEYLILNKGAVTQMAVNAYNDVLKHRTINQKYRQKIIDQIMFSINKKHNYQYKFDKIIKPKNKNKIINYVTYDKMIKDIINNFHTIAGKYDLIVGVPRSGMVPAYVIATLSNCPVLTMDEFVHQIKQTKGDRVLQVSQGSVLRVLVIDDSINFGRAYKRALNVLPETYQNKKYVYEFLAIYGSENANYKDVKFFSKIENPRIFQWNYKNHCIANKACYDLDGVLCVDPTDEENDDGNRYIEFILNAKPLYIPKYKIRAIVTSRLEKYRKETEAWLQKNNVIYEELYMLDLPSKEERIKRKIHGKYKARIYNELNECDLFIESSISQSKEISQLTSKSVMCTENDFLYCFDK